MRETAVSPLNRASGYAQDAALNGGLSFGLTSADDADNGLPLSDRSGFVSAFQVAIQNARLSLPYPDEQVGQITADQLQRIAETILHPHDQAAMLQVARTMPSRQLMLMFPLLASRSSRNDLTDRVMMIIRERACASLLQMGYITFQRHYPNPLVARAIDELCQILRIRCVPYQSTVHDFIRITSRSLVARCARKTLDKRYSLHRFLTTYRIDPLLPFGSQLCVQLFRIGDESVYQDSALLFERVLTSATPETQAALLNRFFKLERLTPQMFDEYCQIIFEHLGEPVDNLPAWDHVRPNDLVRYAAWIREATIGSHFKSNPELARFFLRYRKSLISVSELGRDTLVLHFPGYTVTHSHRWPESAMYRDLSATPEQQKAHRDPSDDHAEISHADPRRPHRLPMEALKKSSTAGRVLLLLDREGIRQSAVFLDYCLSRFRAIPGAGWFRRAFM